MGKAMARNVMAAGMAVRAWNRTRERAEDLAGEGARLAATPAEAADGADVVLTMLADGDAVVGAMDGDDGALAGAGDGTVWLQASTIGEAATARCAALARDAGVPFVDAPVLGTKQPAEQGALIVLASGPQGAPRARASRARCDRSAHDVVGEAGAGTRLKLVTNAWILAVVEGAAEAVALAEGLGLDPGLLLEAVEGGPLDLPYLRTKAAAMRDRDFTPSFRLALAAKDAALVEEAADGHGMDLPLVGAIAAGWRRGSPRTATTTSAPPTSPARRADDAIDPCGWPGGHATS